MMVQTRSGRSGGNVEVRTPLIRAIELVVPTQRTGRYVFWTKRRLQRASSRFAATVRLGRRGDPALYVIPSTVWSVVSPRRLVGSGGGST
jgi:hypothetical protein